MPKSKTLLFNPAFGLAIRIQQVLVGLELGFFARNSEDHKTSLGTVKAYLSTHAVNTQKLVIAPQVRIAFQHLYYEHTATATSTNFNDLISTNRNTIGIEHRSKSLDFGIALKSRDQNFPRKTRSLLRVGYQFGLASKEWKVRRSNSTGGPVDRFKGFYIALVQGIGT